MNKKVFIPSSRYGYILDVILVVVLFIAIVNFPTNIFKFQVMDPDEIGNLSAIFRVGFPVTFFEIDLYRANNMPIKIVPLILSLIGYFLLAYIIDVLISLIIFAIKGPPEKLETLAQARKAYFYRRNQGESEDEIKKEFREKGWTELQIDALLSDSRGDSATYKVTKEENGAKILPPGSIGQMNTNANQKNIIPKPISPVINVSISNPNASKSSDNTNKNIFSEKSQSNISPIIPPVQNNNLTTQKPIFNEENKKINNLDSSKPSKGFFLNDSKNK